MLAAEEDLPLVNVWEEGRATKYAAQAMLARMYLQRHDYENALKYCNLVIGDGNNFHLYNNYADIYDPANKNQGYEIFLKYSTGPVLNLKMKVLRQQTFSFLSSFRELFIPDGNVWTD